MNAETVSTVSSTPADNPMSFSHGADRQMGPATLPTVGRAELMTLQPPSTNIILEFQLRPVRHAPMIR